MRPTIRQLEYVVAVAEEGTFSRAAERCFVSQPSLSSQVRQLELRLGADLFERTPKGALVTPVGRDVVEVARELLSMADRIVQRTRAAEEPLTGLLRLGSVSTVTPYLLPAAIAELATAHPALRIQLRDDFAARLKSQVENGDIDALVTPLPAPLAGCEEVELARDPFVLAAPRASALAKLPEPLDEEALSGHEMLLLEDPHCLRNHALEICSRLGASPNTALHATSISAAVQLVRRGLGSTLLPALSLEVELAAAPEIEVKRFAEPAPARRIGLVWRRGSGRSDEFKMLASILMKHAEALALLH